MQNIRKLVVVMVALLSSSMIFTNLGMFANAVTPKYGGTLIVGFAYEQLSMNPHYRKDEQAARLSIMGYLDPLVGNDDWFGTGEVYPILAKSWEVSPDATVYTFHLYENVSWHDGHKFTSHDVAYTFTEIKEESGATVRFFEDMDRIETPDDYTVKIILKNPNAGLLAQLGGYYAPGILPAHIYEGTDWTINPANQAPIGTGPFKFVEWVKGDHTILEAYDDYHLGRPYLDRVIVRAPIPEATAMPLLRAGEISYYGVEVPAADALALKDDPNFQYFVVPDNTLQAITFNMLHEPFDDVRVRKAICMAINRTDITERVTMGFATPAAGAYYKDHWAFNPDAQQLEYNPERAEELLDEAEYPRDPQTGIRFTTSLGTHTNPMVAPVKPVAKEYLKAIGIEISLWEMKWPEYWERVLRGDYDMGTLAGLTAPDPVDYEKVCTSTGYANIQGMQELYPEEQARIDELMMQGKSTFDKEERAEYYREVQQIMIDVMPRFFLWEGASPQVFSAEYGLPPFTQEATGRGYTIHRYYKTFWTKGSDISPESAMEAIEHAETELNELADKGYNVTDAMNTINSAKTAYDGGDYVRAFNLANDAADMALPPSGIPYEIYAAVAVAAIIIVGSAAYFYKKRKR